MGTGVLRIIRNLDVGTVSRKKTKTLKKLKRLCFLNKETKKGRKRFRYNFAPLLNEGSCGRCIRETAKLVQKFGCQSFPLHSQQKRDNLGEG